MTRPRPSNPRTLSANSRGEIASRFSSRCSPPSPAAAQRELAARYGFDPGRWGRITAGVLLAVGAANALASLAVLAAGRGDLWDAAGLVVGGLLAAEQVRRLRLLRRHEPAGSVLGALILSMAAPLFGAP